MIEHLLSTNTDIDILILSELWKNKNFCDSIVLPNYKIASIYCRKNYEGGGVGILLKNTIDFIERKDIVNLSVEHVIEFCAIEIPKQNVILIGLYRADRNINIFYEQMDRLLSKLRSKDNSKYIIIGGDFNINMKEKSTQSRDFLNFMRTFNLLQLIKEPTRVTNRSATCIDLIFTNHSPLIHSTNVNDYGLSDHKATCVKLNSIQSLHKKQIYYTQKRLYTKTKIAQFKNSLAEINWGDVLTNNQNANDNYSAFQKIINDNLNMHIPLCKIKIKPTKNKSWLTKGLKKSCLHKRVLKTILNETKSKVIKNYFNLYNKILKRSVKTSKRLDYIKQMKASDNKVKTMWNIINNKTGKIKQKCHNNIELTINKKTVKCPIKISNTFNEHFASIGEIHKTKNNININKYPVINSPTSSIYLNPVDQKEILTIIHQLKNKHSCGIDDVPPALLKQCADELSNPLTFLINQSFEEGLFPDELKVALIKPLLKKDSSKDNPSSYRPIALLPAFSKIYEKAMCTRLYSFLEKYNILDDCQNGFRKSRSTTLAVFKYIQTALQHINDKQNAIGLLLDMSKAYDRVPYDLLLQKLKGSGIRGPAYNWFRSYLHNRQQIVQIQHYNNNTNELEKVQSAAKHLTSSIPQGSVLGCVLFLLYINDAPKCLKSETTLPVLFADDISILIKADNNTDYNSLIHNTLNNITSWLEHHNLLVNFDKTKIIQFHSYKKPPLDINITFQNKTIDNINSYNLLGLYIDNNLNWKSHIENIKTKLSRFTYALYEINHSTDAATALSAYHAYAYAWLSYGIILWGNSVNANDLFLLQKKCIRIIAQIKNTDSCRPFFIKFNLLTLISIYILDICIFVFKNMTLFKKIQETHNVNTRNKHKLSLPYSRIKMLNCSPMYMAVKIFNKIPTDITIEKNINPFKNKLKKYLITNCFYTLEEFFAAKSK